MKLIPTLSFHLKQNYQPTKEKKQTTNQTNKKQANKKPYLRKGSGKNNNILLNCINNGMDEKH